MEILFISHKYPPATGGMEKQSFELISHMSSMAKVHSIVYEGKGSRLKFFMQLGGKIRKVLRENPGISIIHYNDGLVGAFSMFSKRPGEVKRTVTLHGLDVAFPSFVYQKLIFPKFNAFDLVIAVSKATAAACIMRGLAAEKIVVINNGVDTVMKPYTTRLSVENMLSQKYHADVRGKRILVAMGRAVKRKGFSWFGEKVVPLVHKDFTLLIIGPIQKKTAGTILLSQFLPPFISSRIQLFLGAASDERSLRKLIRQPENEHKIHRLGKLPQEDVDSILGVADAFVMPNIEIKGDMEGFGLVCLEACMRGTKVFAAASGGITDAIIHKQNGTLLPPGHVVTWAHAINQIIEDPDSQLSADQTISFTRERFGWQKMADEYLLHLRRLL